MKNLGILAVVFISLLLMSNVVMATVNWECNTCINCTLAIQNASAGDIILATADMTQLVGSCIADPSNFNNLTFDCQMHTIIGNDAGPNDSGFNIVGQQNNTIQNCKINHMSYGLYANTGSSNNKFINNTVYSGRCGVKSGATAGNQYVLNNTFDTLSDGVYPGSTNNTVVNNILRTMSGYGFRLLSNTGSNIIENNTFESGSIGANIESKYNNFTNNIFRVFQAGYGLMLAGGTDNTFTNNFVTNNQTIYPEVSIDAISLNNVFTNLNVNGTNISFTTGGGIRIQDVLDNARPIKTDNISVYINVTNTSATSWIDLKLGYNQATVEALGYDEDNLTLWRFNESQNQQTSITDLTYDYLYKNIIGGAFSDTGNSIWGIIYIDTTVPIITLVGVNPQIVEFGMPYVLLGATALDNHDGDITTNIIINNSAVNVNIVGSYIVTYDVIDAAGNAAIQLTRTINVVDTTLPVITLLGIDPQIIVVGTVYTDAGATALDNYDGDITGSIATVNPVIDAVGTYTVTYDVTDSSLNSATQVTRIVNVVKIDSTNLLHLSLNGIENNLTVTSPTQTNSTGWKNFTDGDLTLYLNGVNTTNLMDIRTLSPGTYNYTLELTGATNYTNSSVSRFLIVNSAPIITPSPSGGYNNNGGGFVPIKNKTVENKTEEAVPEVTSVILEQNIVEPVSTGPTGLIFGLTENTLIGIAVVGIISIVGAFYYIKNIRLKPKTSKRRK